MGESEQGAEKGVSEESSPLCRKGAEIFGERIAALKMYYGFFDGLHAKRQSSV
jgi:hypothetical protein